MKIVHRTLALAGCAFAANLQAITTNDIQLWTGSGTNRAAMVIEWNSPVVFNLTTVPAPVANKTMVWGYQFNGTATGTQMLDAILASDPRLYAVINTAYGATIVEGLGYNLNDNGVFGITDGTNTYSASAFTEGVLLNPDLDADAASPINSGDLYWSGWLGPNWNTWNEMSDNGGFAASPNRGSSPYWDADTWTQGQWEFANYGLDELPLQDGSWIGFSVAAAGYDDNTNDAAYTAFNQDEQAPPSPDGTYTAYVCNTNDFAVQIVSTTNLDTASPYNNPAAVLGRPTLQFKNFFGGVSTDRVSIVDDPFNVAPNGSDVITEIKSSGEITVKMGRKVYNNPNNPYGIDLIVYGNSYFIASGYSGGSVSDAANLNTTLIPGGISGIYGHSTVISVSQDGTNWYSYAATPALFPDNAFRWDDANASWTDEWMNSTKPLNPAINIPVNSTVAFALDQFIGSSGGSGYDLAASGYPWIQYVRVQPGAGTYTVIDAIAAVNPAVVGDALSITPDNLSSGITNLAFQNPADTCQNLISINFDSVSDIAKVSTVALSEFSSFAPAIGNVSSAYQITISPVTDANAVTYVADIGLRAGGSYTGNGSDLRVYQWSGTNWTSQPFTYNSTNNEVLVAGVTNFSTFVLSQIVPPQISIQAGTNSIKFQFTPAPHCGGTLERSTDLVTWTAISTFTATNAQTVTLQDTQASASQAFYRLLLNIP